MEQTLRQPGTEYTECIVEERFASKDTLLASDMKMTANVVKEHDNELQEISILTDE